MSEILKKNIYKEEEKEKQFLENIYNEHINKLKKRHNIENKNLILKQQGEIDILNSWLLKSQEMFKKLNLN